MTIFSEYQDLLPSNTRLNLLHQCGHNVTHVHIIGCLKTNTETTLLICLFVKWTSAFSIEGQWLSTWAWICKEPIKCSAVCVMHPNKGSGKSRNSMHIYLLSHLVDKQRRICSLYEVCAHSFLFPFCFRPQRVGWCSGTWLSFGG